MRAVQEDDRTRGRSRLPARGGLQPSIGIYPPCEARLDPLLPCVRAAQHALLNLRDLIGVEPFLEASHAFPPALRAPSCTMACHYSCVAAVT